MPNGKECHYLAVKIPSALLRGITSKYHGYFLMSQLLLLLLQQNKKVNLIKNL